jgi:3-oxoacyl-[acyl-carrier-protein] synthase II
MSVAVLSRDREQVRAVPLAITSCAIHVPESEPLQRMGLCDGEPAVPAERAHELLGRKGLLAKDEATRLALCAVWRALGGAVRHPAPAEALDPDTAVVACSNLGNVGGVIRIARTARTEGGRNVSVLDAPNASSNVIASTVAIWFRFGGPNLMVCSGATAGLDAVALGGLLLRSGRAKRVVVVGAEPADPVAAQIRGARAPATERTRAPAAAAAIILEPSTGWYGFAPALGPVGFTPPDSGRAATDQLPDNVRLVIGPRSLRAGTDLEFVDLEAEVGDLYGAAGVVQVAAATTLAARTGRAVSVICGDADDGWRTATVGAPGAQGAGI